MKLEIRAASVRNIVKTVWLFASMAFSIPTARVLSMTETVIMFVMPMPATISEMEATARRKICMKSSSGRSSATLGHR
jgi:hypothetical protein